MEKAPEAFRTISEVADDLDLPQHVLRFWETRFSQIRPLKRGGGRRYYRPDDVDLLKGIRHYLYGEGYTIRGVQRILKERGLRHVVETGRLAGEAPVPAVAGIPRGDGGAETGAGLPPGWELPEDEGPVMTIAGEEATPGLSREMVRRLREALFELAECRRILDAAR